MCIWRRGVRGAAWGALILLELGFAACGPFKTGAPPTHAFRISDLNVRPERTQAGCPTTLSFKFEDAEADIAIVRGHRRGKSITGRYLTLPIEREAFAGKHRGEVQARLTAEGHGRQYYAIQLEDRAGHRSNVLETAVWVDVPFPWRRRSPKCAE